MKHTIPFIGRLTTENTQDWLDLLNNRMLEVSVVPLEALEDGARESVEVAIVANPDPADLDGLPNLKWIQSVWAGVEWLLSDYHSEDVKIVRLVDPQLSQTMAEAALTWSLFILRDIPLYRRQQEQKLWLQHELPLPSDTTVGVLGLGALGKHAALRLADSGFNVVGWSRSPADIPGVKTFAGIEEMPEVLRQSDILIVLLPLSPQTQGLLNAGRFSQMKRGVSIVNFGRGLIIDDTALLQSLDTGQVKHAVLDVFAVEPLPENHAFWDRADVTVLPHNSAPTNKKTAIDIVAQNIKGYLESGHIPDCVSRKHGY